MYYVKMSLAELAKKGVIELSNGEPYTETFKPDMGSFRTGFSRIPFCDVDQLRLSRLMHKVRNLPELFQDGIHTALTSAWLMSTQDKEYLMTDYESNLEEASLSHKKISFCCLNENDEVCGLSIQYRQDFPDRWILTLNENVLAEAIQDVRVESFIHFDRPNKHILQAMTNLNAQTLQEMPVWKSPLPVFVLIFLTRCFNDAGQVNLDFMDQCSSNPVTTFFGQRDKTSGVDNATKLFRVEVPKQFEAQFESLEKQLGADSTQSNYTRFKINMAKLLLKTQHCNEMLEWPDLKAQIHQVRDEYIATLDYHPVIHEILRFVDTLIWLFTASLAQTVHQKYTGRYWFFEHNEAAACVVDCTEAIEANFCLPPA